MKVKTWMFLALLAMTGCYRDINKDYTQDPQYCSVMKKEYQTKDELVILSFSRKKILDIARIGRNQVSPDRSEMPEVFPFKYYGRTIWGLLPLGSRFKIVGVKEEGNEKAGSWVHYYVEITESSDAQWVGKIMRENLTDLENPLPHFKPDLVQEVR